MDSSNDKLIAFDVHKIIFDIVVNISFLFNRSHWVFKNG